MNTLISRCGHDPRKLPLFVITLFFLVASPSGALAQDTDSTSQSSGAPPIADAENAYGLRVGNEEIGLYDSNSIRGFVLDTGANYRLDGVFVSAISFRAQRTEAATSIQAGPNLFAARLPSPTGVVDLLTDHKAAPARNLIIRGDGFGTIEILGRLAIPVPDGTFWLVAEDRNVRDWHGGDNRFTYGAAGGRWAPDNWNIQGGLSFGSYNNALPLAVYTTVPADELPAFRPGSAARPAWASITGKEMLGWFSAERALGKDWYAQAGLAHAHYNTERDAFVFIDDVDTSGRGQMRATVFGQTVAQATSAELVVERRRSTRSGMSRLSFMALGRDQAARLPVSNTIELGTLRINDRLRPTDPGAPFGTAARDIIREGRVAVSLSHPFGRFLRFSASVQRVAYTKGYIPAGEVFNTATDREWAGHLAATVTVAPSLSVYGAWVTGLEESGSAPAVAINANETLPALRASQRELGAKLALGARTSVILSAFDIEKGAPGFDLNGFWVLNGARSHRGLEASLVSAFDNIQVIAGGLFLDAAISEATGTRAEVVGQPRWRGSLNAQWQVNEQIAIDTGAYLLGSAPARRDGTTRIPARVDLSFGVTWRLGARDTAPTFRIAGTNLLDNRAWVANDDESLMPVETRAVRASIAFGW